jgi:hypothetical protein
MRAANGLGHLAAYLPRSVVSRKAFDEGTRRPSKAGRTPPAGRFHQRRPSLASAA